MKIEKIAQQLVIPGKGILAADESSGTIEKRFKKINVESTEENRRAYRELLFTAPGVEEFISGVIMFEETLRDNDGELAKVLSDKGIIPGIKVDQGKEEIKEFPGEMVTKGLEGLGERLEEYKKLGAKFAKWRAVFTITEKTPSIELITRNAKDLAKYAKVCQEHDFVPIIEPEILMDGDHDIKKCAEVTAKVLENVYASLFDEDVYPEATLLKVNFIHPGKEYSSKPSPQEVARETLDVMRTGVSVAVPGIVFLSGGLAPEEATNYLNAINQLISKEKKVWQLSFSFGRALQAPVLEAWKGDSNNASMAQEAFLKRAKLNSLAVKGEYQESMENE